MRITKSNVGRLQMESEPGKQTQGSINSAVTEQKQKETKTV